MALLMLLLVLAWERLFKLGEHWQFDHHIKPLFKGLKRASLVQTICLVIGWMAIVFFILFIFKNILYGLLSFILAFIICLFCIGAGEIRQHYRAYLTALKSQDQQATDKLAQELLIIHSLYPQEQTDKAHELQNTLLWINFRFYLAPLFWLLFGAAISFIYGPLLLAGYALLRAYQTFLATHGDNTLRADSKIDCILHYVDWIPARLAGFTYALLGQGEKALPLWLSYLSDITHSPYRVLTSLARFALDKEGVDGESNGAVVAVSLAKQATVLIILVVAVFSILGVFI